MFTDSQYRALAALVSQPGTELSMSELGEAIGKQPGVFQRGLNSLEKQGLVVSRRRGNMRLFKINQDHALSEEIKSIISKTYGIEGSLRELVSRIPDVVTALIYGSYAKNAMRVDSDIDLLLVCDSEYAEDKLLGDLEGVEKLLQREINYKLYSQAEFDGKRREQDPFLEEVLSGPHIVLKGNL